MNDETDAAYDETDPAYIKELKELEDSFSKLKGPELPPSKEHEKWPWFQLLRVTRSWGQLQSDYEFLTMSGIAHATFSEVLDDPEVLGGFFAGESWDGWRIISKAAFGVQLNEMETEFCRSIADRDPPKSSRAVAYHWSARRQRRLRLRACRLLRGLRRLQRHSASR